MGPMDATNRRGVRAGAGRQRGGWLLLAILLLPGCAATVVCPAVEGEARAAVLLDHGTHASLVVEEATGRAIRYSYGDRRWYAEGDTGISAGFQALFLRTDAVLGRRALRAPPDPDSIPDRIPDLISAELGIEVEHAFPLRIDAERADDLLAGLQAIYDREPRPFVSSFGVEFAPHPRPYTFFYNSNHMVADWLDRLGCETGGNPVLSHWRVTQD